MKPCACGAEPIPNDHRCRECRNRRKRELRAGAPLLKKGPKPKPGHSRTAAQKRAFQARVQSEAERMIQQNPGLPRALQVLWEVYSCGR